MDDSLRMPATPRYVRHGTKNIMQSMLKMHMPAASSKISESRSMSIELFSIHKMDDARYAEFLKRKRNGASPSIMITKQELFEGYSAATAIKDSDASKIRFSFYSLQLTISGAPNARRTASDV